MIRRRIVTASIVLIALLTIAAPAVGGGASSFSAAPDGTKAALLLLQQLGYRVDRSFEPATVVGSDPRHTLLLLVDPDEHASELDRRSVREFVAAGGALLATGCGATFLTSSAPQKDATVAKSRVRARESGPLTAGAPEIDPDNPNLFVFEPRIVPANAR